MNQVVDAEERIQALDPSQSFIVQAPAGSGKTELLTQRYLSLLARVEQPESILAITFTRKAASEMRERIIHALTTARRDSEPASEPNKTSWRLATQVLATDERFEWDILKNPQRMQIQTIDSFNNALVKRMPSLAGLGADLKTLEDAEALYQMAADQTLDLLEDDQYGESIAHYLLHLDGNRYRARKLLIDMLKCRDQWINHLTQEDKQDRFRRFIESSLNDVIEQEISAINASFNVAEIGRINQVSNFALEILRANGDRKFFSRIYESDRSFNLGFVDHSNLDEWRDISFWLLNSDQKGVLKTYDVRRGFPAQSVGANATEKALFKTRKEQMTELANDLRDREHLLARIWRLPNPNFAESEWEHLSSLINCLKLALAQLKILFAERDRLDFQEVAIRANIALDIENTDLALIMDYQIQHILIDEFQDTSQSQNVLLKKLTKEWQPDDGKTLFLVGDPMQSIYRFREADVGLFLHAVQHGLGEMPLTPIRLRTNFRSSHDIVSWVNHHFQQILPMTEDIYRGAVTYSDSEPFHVDRPGDVECLFFESMASEAEYISEVVERQLAADPDSNIAILVRGRNHLIEILPKLYRKGIRYQATEIESLADRPVISDLQMLLRAINDPTDRVAWLALLRAPWCGLKLKDLQIIASFAGSVILDNIRNELIYGQLSDDAKYRLDGFLAIILPWLEEHHRSITDKVESIWLSLDGPAYLRSASDLDAVQMFFTMLTEVTQAGQLIPDADFKFALAKLYAPPDPLANPRVQVMTIHKSKGLQFDTVIVPALNAKGANDSNTLLRWMTTTDGLLMSPLSIDDNDDSRNYQYLKDIQNERGEQERKRLLYVACTRAKNHLILTNTVTLKKDEIKPTSGSLLSDLWPTLSEPYIWPMGGGSTAELTLLDEEDIKEPTHDNRLYRRADNHYHSLTLIQNTPSVELMKNPSGIDDFPNASLYRRAVGIIVHRWLEIIADDVNLWDASKLEEKRTIIAHQLLREGVSLSEQANATSEVIKHLQLTLDSDTGSRVLKKYDDSTSELALERIEGSTVKFYIIDRTFIDEEGTRWIVDYKTSHHEGSELDDFLKMQHEIYRQQLENYAQLMHAIERRPVKLMLYFTLYQRSIIWDWPGSLSN